MKNTNLLIPFSNTKKNDKNIQGEFVFLENGSHLFFTLKRH